MRPSADCQPSKGSSSAIHKKLTFVQCMKQQSRESNVYDYVEHEGPLSGNCGSRVINDQEFKLNRKIKKAPSFILTKTSEPSNPFEISEEAQAYNNLPMSLEQRSTNISSEVKSAHSSLIQKFGTSSIGLNHQEMGEHLSNLHQHLGISRHYSQGFEPLNVQEGMQAEADHTTFSQNVFSSCNSPATYNGHYYRRQNSNISRRLFDDDSNVFQPASQEELGPLDCEMLSQPLNVFQMDRNSLGDDPMSQEEAGDVDEFTQDEQRPLDQLLRMRGRNEFVFDPENGGGRRRRNKKVSRVELLNLQKPPQKMQASQFQIQSQHPKPVLPAFVEPQIVNEYQAPVEISLKPMGVCPTLYSLDDIARMLNKIEEPRNPGKNSISAHTLADFIHSSNLDQTPYIIIDCRFDYEYSGGHIKNAININDPKDMQAFFFKDRETIERLMKTVVIFHCEFSQKRGPAMYQALRELDRRLHAECYPQLFFPEIYILEGGYKNFHEQQPMHCTGGYVPMADKQFKEDCKDKFSLHKKIYKEFNNCSKGQGKRCFEEKENHFQMVESGNQEI